ncbi:hypothetical protein BJ742DRAFT_130912 [Cladochytrium replicatum]|nr:hypothetical protein BJ742DRAFT_130912 [Cladochytrium replicatum]
MDLGLDLDDDLEEAIFRKESMDGQRKTSQGKNSKRSVKSWSNVPAPTLSPYELQEKNSRLQLETEKLKNTVQYLRKELSDTMASGKEEAVVPPSAEATIRGVNGIIDARDSKIVELAKKVRKLTMALEREKTRNSKLQNSLKESESVRKGTETTANLVENISVGHDSETLKNDVKQAKDRLAQTIRKLEEERSTVQALRTELRLTQKALVSEVGDGNPLNKILQSPGNWKGRSQMIALQKVKIKELQEKLAQYEIEDSNELPNNSSFSMSELFEQKNRMSIQRMEQERKILLERAALENESLKAENTELKAKQESFTARIRSLEKMCKDYKDKISTLVEKIQRNDRFVHALKDELERVKSKKKKSDDNLFQNMRQLCGEQVGYMIIHITIIINISLGSTNKQSENPNRGTAAKNWAKARQQAKRTYDVVNYIKDNCGERNCS